MSNIRLICCPFWKDADLKKFCSDNKIPLSWNGYSILPIDDISPLQTTWKIPEEHLKKVLEFLETI